MISSQYFLWRLHIWYMIKKTLWIEKIYNKHFNQITMDVSITIFGPSLQEISTFLTGNSRQKKNPIWFFCHRDQFDQKWPIWPKCHFGQINLDPTILIGSFWLVILTGFFLLNHHDNNIIWIATIIIYYLNYFISN